MSWKSTTVLDQESLRENGFFFAKHKAAWQDCFFLAAIMCLSVVLYIHNIGFYSDDWAYFSLYEASPDKSLLGRFQTLIVSPNIRSRPVQAFLQGLIYWLFGLQPLEHHLFNTGMLLVSMWLLYFILRELQIGRVLAVAIPLTFSLLPHYSTDRLWHSAFMVNLSMLFYFLSLYADLRVFYNTGLKTWLWKIVSIVCLAGSALSYEIFMPLFFINPLVVWYLSRKLSTSNSVPQLVNKRWHYLYILNLITLILVVVYKLATATRMGTLSLLDHLHWFAFIIIRAARVSFSKFGIKLPGVIANSMEQYAASKTILVLAVIAGLVTFTYLNIIMRQSDERKSGMFFICLSVVGLFLFAAGFGIFLTNTNAIITPTGINNRIVLASALGVAIVFVGAIGWLSHFTTSARLYRYVFSSLIAIVCAASFFVTNVIASFWADSYTRQKQIVADINAQFPQLPGKSTLILDGACPYSGPAVVFESSWDLAGALSISYQDTTIHADIVTPNLKIEEKGIVTLMYEGANRTFHAYSNRLFVYHLGRKTVHYLPDARAAEEYFRVYNPDFNNDCPQGSEGLGVDIF
jgi:hypothetical protein